MPTNLTMTTRCCLLGSSLWIAAGFLPGLANAQDSFIIDDAQFTTNGGDALDGDDGITVTETGSVTTGLDDEYGLYGTGGNNTLTNNGSVVTDGVDAFGFYGLNGNDTLTNNGSVLTTGEGAFGLYARNGSNTVINSGSVITSGDGASGLYGRNGNNTVTNSGSVVTTGAGAFGLRANNGNNTVTNSGTVFAMAGQSIRVVGAGNEVALLEGSVLYGDVNFNNADGTFRFGPGLNASVHLSNATPDTIIAPNGAFVVDGGTDTIHAIDSTGFAASDQRVEELGAQVLAALDRLGPGTANPEVTQGQAGSDGFAWGGVIGAVGIGGETDTTAGYALATGGIIGGYTFDGNTGFFLGLAATRQESDSSFEQDTQTLFGGLHAGFALGSVNVDASLIAGVGQTDQTRTIANNTVLGPVIGIETAEADYDTAFVMPAVTISGDMDRGSDSFTPSVRLRYAKINQDGFDETGSATALLSVEDREAEFLEVRVQVERGLEDKRVGEATMSTRMRMGFDAQVFSGDDVDLTVATQDLNFGIHDEDVVGRFFVGTDLVRIGDSGSQLTAGFEAGIDTTKRVDVSGGVEWVLSF